MALGWIAWISGTCANLVYHLFNPLVEINPDGKIITVLVRHAEQTAAIASPYKSYLRLDTVTYGMPMLAALTIVTRADSIRAKARALGAGLLAMMLLTVPIVMLWAKLATVELEDQMAQAAQANAMAQAAQSGARSSFFFYTFHGYAFSQPVVAIAIWLALLMLGLFKSKPRDEAPLASVARNAPCPCGSGRKYKRCCGRA